MAFRFIKRGEDTLTRRSFACDECEIEWTVWLERDAPYPECPVCEAKAQAAVTSPAVLTTKSKAIDIAQETMEAMGYTDFNDNQRVGDIAVKTPPPMTTVDKESLMQRSAEVARELEVPPLADNPQVPGGLSQAAMAQNFWQMGGTSPAVPAPASTALTTAAMAGARQARAEGSDPMALLHAKKPPFKLDVVADDRPSR